MKEELRELLGCYLCFMEVRQQSKDETNSRSKFPSNLELEERIKRINRNFLNDSTLEDALSKMRKKGTSNFNTYFGKSDFKLKTFRKGSIHGEITERRSMRSSRGGESSRSSFRDGSNREITASQGREKKIPIKTLKLDFLLSVKDPAFRKIPQLNDTLKTKNPMKGAKTPSQVKDSKQNPNPELKAFSKSEQEEIRVGRVSEPMNKSDLDEILKNFGIKSRNIEEKSVSEASEMPLEHQNGSELDGSDFNDQTVNLSLKGQVSNPRDWKDGDSHSEGDREPPIKVMPKKKAVDLNSTAIESMHKRHSLKQPSKFAVYKGIAS